MAGPPERLNDNTAGISAIASETDAMAGEGQCPEMTIFPPSAKSAKTPQPFEITR